MKNPYEVLGLPPDSDEDAIRQRYLQLVRQHPPDQSPQQFAEIRAAYDDLRDPVLRLKTRMFANDNRDSFDEIIAEVRKRVRAARIPVETLLSLAEK